jgi:hypothetical protein
MDINAEDVVGVCEKNQMEGTSNSPEENRCLTSSDILPCVERWLVGTFLVLCLGNVQCLDEELKFHQVSSPEHLICDLDVIHPLLGS